MAEDLRVAIQAENLKYWQETTHLRMKSIADLANGIFRGLLLLNGGAMGAIFFALLALGFFIAGCGPLFTRLAWQILRLHCLRRHQRTSPECQNACPNGCTNDKRHHAEKWLICVVPGNGLEPLTYRLQGGCSTS